MLIRTTRFGSLEIHRGDLIRFPHGLLGFEDCTDWVVLADAQNQMLGWLQSAQRPEVALPVVSPRRLLPDYQFRVYRSELAVLELSDIRDAHVLTIVGKNEGCLTLNLKAPVVINLQRRLGRQIVANGEQPIAYRLNSPRRELRKSA